MKFRLKPVCSILVLVLMLTLLILKDNIIGVYAQNVVIDFRDKTGDKHQGFDVYQTRDTKTRQIYIVNSKTNERTWHNVNGMKGYEDAAPLLDTRILKIYNIPVYALSGDGVRSISNSDQRFMNSSAGLDKALDGTSPGEYKYLGFKEDGVTKVTNDRYFIDANRLGKVFSDDYKYYKDSSGHQYEIRWIEPPAYSDDDNALEDSWYRFDNESYGSRNLFTTARVKYLMSLPTYDSDHPSALKPGAPNVPTGHTLIDILSGGKATPSDQDYINAMKKALLLNEVTDGSETKMSVKLWYQVLDANHHVISTDYNTIQVYYNNLDNLTLDLTSSEPTAADDSGTYSITVNKGEDVTINVTAGGTLMQNVDGIDVTMQVNNQIFDSAAYSDIHVIEKLSTQIPATAMIKPYTFKIENITVDSNAVIEINSTRVLNESEYNDNIVQLNIHVLDTVVPPSSQPSQPPITPSASPSAVLYAEQRDSERFDVSQGIPSSENLYANVTTNEYTYTFQHDQVNGSVTYSVTVNHLDEDGNPTHTTFTFSKSYSYYVVSSFELYAIESATVNNAALPGGKVVLTPSAAYQVPQVDYQSSGQVSTGSTSIIISSASSDPETIQAAAQNAVPTPSVSNDQLTVNGKVVLDGSSTSSNGSSPNTGNLTPGMISRDALYVRNIKIPDTIRNGVYSSNGIITYKRTYQVNPTGPANKSFPITPINPVKVHTPVYAAMTVSDDDAHNQMVNPSDTASSIILSRTFTLDLSHTGQHLNIPGYGNRDYTAYIKDRQINIPFDVYLGTDRDGTYLRGNTWYSLKSLGIDNTVHSITFYAPTWVREGPYSIQMRTLALNDTSNGTSTENNSNLNLSHTVGLVSKSVEVSGRVYDLKVTDVQDYAWELFFRKVKGKPEATGKAFYTGNSTINGTVDSKRTYTYPIMPGKNDVKGFDKIAVKLGYGFHFELKTIGNYSDELDFVRVQPTFYFVDKAGKHRQEVDLYYATPKTPMIRIGDASKDTLTQSVKLNFAYRGIPTDEFTKTADAMFQLRGSIKDFTLDSWKTSFPKISQNGVTASKYYKILLSEPIRSYIGPETDLPSGVSNYKSLASVQKWYGEYALPSDCLAVPKGTDLSKLRNLTASSPVFLKEGYIIVSFKDIAVINEDNFTNPALQYTGKTGDGWSLENYNLNQNGWELMPGDVMVYYADKRSTEDINSTGTH